MKKFILLLLMIIYSNSGYSSFANDNYSKQRVEYYKLKEKWEGKYFVPKEKFFVDQLNTDEPMAYIFTDTLKAIDIKFKTIADFVEPCVIFEDRNGIKTYALEMHCVSILKNLSDLYSKYDYLVKEYGKENAQLIITGDIKIGFSTGMCIIALGTPLSINRHDSNKGSFEQWVYEDKYLYFDNNKLTDIQIRF